MKVLVFTEGTVLMHKKAQGKKRKEIIQQVKKKEPSVKDYSSYVPIEKAVEKLLHWKQQGAKIIYLTSRRKKEQIQHIRNVLKKYRFPVGTVVFRKEGEEYKDVVERVSPDVYIEDDCESIGKEEIAITYVHPKIRKKISSFVVKEFGGIDALPNEIKKLSELASNKRLIQ